MARSTKSNGKATNSKAANTNAAAPQNIDPTLAALLMDSLGQEDLPRSFLPGFLNVLDSELEVIRALMQSEGFDDTTNFDQIGHAIYGMQKRIRLVLELDGRFARAQREGA